MRSVRSHDTKPELTVRKLAWRIRPGYRLNRKDIPGKPDIAYGVGRKAVFVHGCFWHGHDCRRGARVPKHNKEYWVGKVARNRQRDAKALQALESLGWRCLVIWECELKEIEKIETRLRGFLAA